MEQNWKVVAEALRASRLAQGWSQEELATRANTSRATIQNLEYGPARKRISRKLQDVTEALGWPPGHVGALLAGAAAGLPNGSPEPAPTPQRSDLPLAVARELGAGDLLDTQVLDLGGSDARMIVVVRAADGATPEQIEQALEQWRHVQQNLQVGETHAG
ncbi:helix-turn-helix domain-containing protein [Streptomyces sp. NPDC059534]|uniref:helix-turn-helix domain-containing protein n=1 Tax=Streptomyces sp. NPDC059534 TaxID=3346859 RepID=UPI00368AF47C